MERLTSDSQFHPDFTSCLGGITLESLQQGHRFCLSLHLCIPNGIGVDAAWCYQIHLPSRRNPPLNEVKSAIGIGNTPEWSVDLDSLIQQQTNTGGVFPVTGPLEGSLPVTQVHIDIRGGKEDGDNGVVAILTGNVQGSSETWILPIDIEGGFFLRTSFISFASPLWAALQKASIVRSQLSKEETRKKEKLEKIIPTVFFSFLFFFFLSFFFFFFLSTGVFCSRENPAPCRPPRR